MGRPMGRTYLQDAASARRSVPGYSSQNIYASPEPGPRALSLRVGEVHDFMGEVHDVMAGLGSPLALRAEFSRRPRCDEFEVGLVLLCICTLFQGMEETAPLLTTAGRGVGARRRGKASHTATPQAAGVTCGPAAPRGAKGRAGHRKGGQAVGLLGSEILRLKNSLSEAKGSQREGRPRSKMFSTSPRRRKSAGNSSISLAQNNKALAAQVASLREALVRASRAKTATTRALIAARTRPAVADASTQTGDEAPPAEPPAKRARIVDDGSGGGAAPPSRLNCRHGCGRTFALPCHRGKHEKSCALRAG